MFEPPKPWQPEEPAAFEPPAPWHPEKDAYSHTEPPVSFQSCCPGLSECPDGTYNAHVRQTDEYIVVHKVGCACAVIATALDGPVDDGVVFHTCDIELIERVYPPSDNHPL